MALPIAVAASVLPASRSRLATLFKSHRGQPPDAILPLIADACRLPESAAGAALATAEALLAAGRRAGLAALTWSDAAYPALLDCIPDPPPVLWVRGDPAVLTAPIVAVVGSRAATEYARQVACRLGTELAGRGVIVASGLARGVDSVAHAGALDGGRTVAVLGCGADRVYPAEHADLAAAIARRGAVISELGPGAPPLPEHFPLRNRIISGLALAVVVVEASEQSGSLITARCALEQGREVMAVPGSVLSGRNRGSHSLLKDGATIVETAADVLGALGWTAMSGPEAPGQLAEEADPLLARMESGERYRLDDLIQLTGVAGPRLLTRLTELELQGRISAAGGVYTRAVAR